MSEAQRLMSLSSCEAAFYKMRSSVGECDVKGRQTRRCQQLVLEQEIEKERTLIEKSSIELPLCPRMKLDPLPSNSEILLFRSAMTFS